MSERKVNQRVIALPPEPNSDAKARERKTVTIEDLGWTEEYAAAIRARISADVLDDWDDPSMDVYDDL